MGYGSEEIDMQNYLKAGEKRALNLSNRGPIRFNKDGTLSGTFSGESEGFFGSTGSSVLGGFLTGGISTGLQALNFAGTLNNASRKGTFSTISTMASLAAPQIAPTLGLIDFTSKAMGYDIDEALGVGSNQGYGAQTSTSFKGSTNNGNNDDIAVGPISKPVNTRPSSQIKSQVTRPDTAATSLLRRGKRKAGNTVYGVTSESPFLFTSDDLETSGMGSYSGSARSGQFKQAPTGR